MNNDHIIIGLLLMVAAPYVILALAYRFASKERGTFQTVVDGFGVLNPANHKYYFSPALIDRYQQTVLVRPEFFSRNRM